MKIHYGLLYVPENKLLGFNTSSNADGEFCTAVAFELDNYSENIWLVEKQEIAEHVRITDTPWYNADYNTPENPFKPEDLKVVKIIIEAEYNEN